MGPGWLGGGSREEEDGELGVGEGNLTACLADCCCQTTSVLQKSLGILTHVVRQLMRNSFCGRKKKNDEPQTKSEKEVTSL